MAIAIVAAGVAGCSAEPERQPGVYDLPIVEVYNRLATSTMPELVFHRQCGILIHVTPARPDGWMLKWRVTSSGKPVASFSAVLKQINATQTKVDILLPQKPNGDGEIYDGNDSYPRPAFNQPLRPAIEEQVAVLLEGRAFDVKRMGRGVDKVCSIQRGGLEHGKRFKVDDIPTMDADESARCRASKNCPT